MYEELLARLDKSYQALNNTFHAKEFVEPIKEAADAIEALSKMETTTPRWISVEERLPEPPKEET